MKKLVVTLLSLATLLGGALLSNEKDDKSVINNNFVNEVKTPANGLFIKESNSIATFNVGERIEAENGVTTALSTVISIDNLSESYGLSNNGCASFYMASSEYIQYLVNAPIEGRYMINVASRSNGGLINNVQTWSINDSDYEVTLNKLKGQGKNTKGYNGYDRFVVSLNAGLNTIKIKQKSGISYLDYFVVENEFASVNTILEAENFASGIYKAYRKTESTDSYVLESPKSNDNKIEFDIRVNKTGYYDLFMRVGNSHAKNSISVFVNKQKYTIIPDKTGLLTSNPDTLGDVNTTIKLYKGKNKIEITNFSNMEYDYLSITDSGIEVPSQGYISLFTYETYTLPEGIEWFVDNETILSLQGNVVVPLSAGNANVYSYVNLANGYSYKRNIQFNIISTIYEGEFVFEDTTLSYNGNDQMIPFEVPEGWKVSYQGYEEGTTLPGTYEITAYLFSDIYTYLVDGEELSAFRLDATLTIEKADYQGEDLIFESKTFAFDGEYHYLTASAPEGWEVTYIDNGKKYAGSIEVTAIFMHEGYNNVVKTATLTIN